MGFFSSSVKCRVTCYIFSVIEWRSMLSVIQIGQKILQEYCKYQKRIKVFFFFFFFRKYVICDLWEMSLEGGITPILKH